jgi:hypothetical protein
VSVEPAVDPNMAKRRAKASDYDPLTTICLEDGTSGLPPPPPLHDTLENICDDDANENPYGDGGEYVNVAKKQRVPRQGTAAAVIALQPLAAQRISDDACVAADVYFRPGHHAEEAVAPGRPPKHGVGVAGEKSAALGDTSAELDGFSTSPVPPQRPPKHALAHEHAAGEGILPPQRPPKPGKEGLMVAFPESEDVDFSTLPPPPPDAGEDELDEVPSHAMTSAAVTTAVASGAELVWGSSRPARRLASQPQRFVLFN